MVQVGIYHYNLSYTWRCISKLIKVFADIFILYDYSLEQLTKKMQWSMSYDSYNLSLWNKLRIHFCRSWEACKNGRAERRDLLQEAVEMAHMVFIYLFPQVF